MSSDAPTSAASIEATSGKDAEPHNGVRAADPPTQDLNDMSVKVTGRLPLPKTVNPQKVLWDYTISLTLMHLLTLLAFVPWLFSWAGVIACVIGIFVFGQGINFCYHRLLTHRSLVVPRWLEHFWVVMALCCLEDTPCKWVTTHRHHHKNSDHQEDPHSPLVTFFWGHFQWLTVHNSGTRTREAYHRYAKDILSDPFYMAMEKNLLIAPAIYLAHGLLFLLGGMIGGWYATGTWLGAWQLGLSMVVWGVILRTVIVWHITWSVNSLSHVFGYQNYDTKEHSTNNWFVALIAVGEGWHNNHHHDQASASNQHKWWELDFTYYHIKVLEWLGLASKVIPPKHIRDQRNAERRAAAAAPDSASAEGDAT